MERGNGESEYLCLRARVRVKRKEMTMQAGRERWKGDPGMQIRKTHHCKTARNLHPFLHKRTPALGTQ